MSFETLINIFSTCSTHGGNEKCIHFGRITLKIRDDVGDLCLYERIISKWIHDKKCELPQNRVQWQRFGKKVKVNLSLCLIN
jgi:hypothetical protein